MSLTKITRLDRLQWFDSYIQVNFTQKLSEAVEQRKLIQDCLHNYIHKYSLNCIYIFWLNTGNDISIINGIQTHFVGNVTQFLEQGKFFSILAYYNDFGFVFTVKIVISYTLFLFFCNMFCLKHNNIIKKRYITQQQYIQQRFQIQCPCLGVNFNPYVEYIVSLQWCVFLIKKQCIHQTFWLSSTNVGLAYFIFRSQYSSVNIH